MRPLTGTDIVNFHTSGADLLVLTLDGKFAHLSASDVAASSYQSGAATAYDFVTTTADDEVQVLLTRGVLVGDKFGDRWFEDAFDERGVLMPSVADEMAGIITDDGILPGIVMKARAAKGRAENAALQAAGDRASAVAEVVAYCGGNQSKAARLLELDQSTVNKLAAKHAARVARSAAEIIAAARETHGDPAAFDFMIATEGIAPFGELYQETYRAANPSPAVPGEGEEQLAERKARAARLWAQVLPELEVYADRCRSASYTGWSRESGGPVRRVGRR